jgi:hypothetical protein
VRANVNFAAESALVGTARAHLPAAVLGDPQDRLPVPTQVAEFRIEGMTCSGLREPDQVLNRMEGVEAR